MGVILSGIETIERIERLKVGQNYRPVSKVLISKSGVVDVPKPFAVKREPVVVKQPSLPLFIISL